MLWRCHRIILIVDNAAHSSLQIAPPCWYESGFQLKRVHRDHSHSGKVLLSKADVEGFLHTSWTTATVTNGKCRCGFSCYKQTPLDSNTHFPQLNGLKFFFRNLQHTRSENGFLDNVMLTHKDRAASGDYHEQMNGNTFWKLHSWKTCTLTYVPIIMMDNVFDHLI